MNPFDQIALKLTNFEIREGQMQMYHDICTAYEQKKICLIEAGTGIGKSLAYLIPAFKWACQHKESTVIATHTIALQEQLMQKDIPFLLDALGLELKVALVKGMSNYVCLRKLHDNQGEISESLIPWSKQVAEGTRTELPMNLSSDLWEQIGAEAESCTYKKCPFFKECFVFKARREAADAKILVVNHHLLFADLAIKEANDNYGDAAVLPTYSRLIIDEAHHCEDVATQYFARQVSLRGLVHLLGRLFSDRGTGKLANLYRKICENKSSYPTQAPHTVTFENLPNQLVELLTVTVPSEKRELTEKTKETFQLLSNFLSQYVVDEKFRLKESHTTHVDWKNHIQIAVNDLWEQGKRFLQSVSLIEKEIKQLKDSQLESNCEGILAEINGICRRLHNNFENLKAFIFDPFVSSQVRWIEGIYPNNLKNWNFGCAKTPGLIDHERPHISNIGSFMIDQSREFSLQPKSNSSGCLGIHSDLHLIAADLEIAPRLSSGLFERLSTIVLCSATLSTNNHFAFFKKRLGISESHESIYQSPFNFTEQAILTIPTDMFEPSHPSFATVAAQKIWDIVQISQGGAFVLFTSYIMLKECAALLADRFYKKGFALFCQGQEGRSALLQKFRTTPKAILFGTDSFWEGVDVAGDALRCVIIVKLPFKVPSEPLFEARCEAIEEQGGSSFFEYSLPHAIIKFKQGFGRLIRTCTDRGAIICLDPRLIKKGYGKKILKSLPPCPLIAETSNEVFATLKKFYSTTA